MMGCPITYSNQSPSGVLAALCNIFRPTSFVSAAADVAVTIRCKVRSISTVDRESLKRSSSA